MTDPALDRRLALWLALLILTIYLLGYSGLFHSIDEHASLAVTETLLAEGRWHTNQMAWEQIWEPSQNAVGLDGHLYSKKGLAIPLLALPLFALGKAWNAVGAVQLTLLLGPLVTAATAYVFYHLARRLDFSPSIAALGTLAWGLGTPAWPYARTLFSEPVAALGLCVALYGIITFRHHIQAARFLFLAGSGLALMVLSRLANTVAVLPFGLYWLYVFWANCTAQRHKEARASGGSAQRAPADRTSACVSRSRWSVLLAQGVALATPIALVLLLMASQSYVHFGKLLGHPLDPVEDFTTPLAVGLAGLLVSPGKGLIWYAPLVLLVVAGAWTWRFRRRLPDLMLAFAVIAVTLLLYSLWWDWPGGTTWGPRLILFTTPALALLALPALDWLVHAHAPWPRLVVTPLLLLSVGMQVPGVLVNTAVLEGWTYYIGITQEQRLWTWMHSPLVSHWHTLLAERITEPLLLQPFFWQRPGWLIAAVLVAGAASIGLGIYGLRHVQRRSGQPRLLFGTLLALAGLMAALVLAAAGDPRWNEQRAEPEDNRQLWSYLRATARPGDVAVVDMLLYYDMVGRTVAWMNAAPLPPAMIGWIRQTAGEEPARLADWLTDYDRIWLSLAMTPPGAPESTTEQWLDGWAYRGREIWFGTQRLIEYLAPGQDVAGAVEGPFRFGDVLSLRNFTVQPGGQPGYQLVELRWDPVDASDLRFSVQVLDNAMQLVDQIDRPPGARQVDGAIVDRIGLIAPTAGYSLILKAYNAASGQRLPFFNAEGQLVGEYLVLQETHPYPERTGKVNANGVD